MMAFDWNAIFTSPNVIGGSHLPDAPLHRSQQTHVPAGETQVEAGSLPAAGQAQAEVGSSQMVTPPMDCDRCRIIRPREPLTTRRPVLEHLRGSGACRFRFSCDFFATTDDYFNLVVILHSLFQSFFYMQQVILISIFIWLL
jgi:hypothetical protein